MPCPQWEDVIWKQLLVTSCGAIHVASFVTALCWLFFFFFSFLNRFSILSSSALISVASAPASVMLCLSCCSRTELRSYFYFERDRTIGIPSCSSQACTPACKAHIQYLLYKKQTPSICAICVDFFCGSCVRCSNHSVSPQSNTLFTYKYPSDNKINSTELKPE